jgi:hypothetical protein
MRPPWKEIDENRIDITLTGIPKEAGSERYSREAAKIIREKYESHEKIYTNGSKKNERAGYAVITPNRTYRRRVHQQNIVFGTEQEPIKKQSEQEAIKKRKEPKER